MKAICLLLCLALAHGHIFKRHHPKLDSLNVQRLESNQAQWEQAVPEASGARINDQIHRESWSSIEHTKPHYYDVSSAERKEIRERQQTPKIQKEAQQYYEEQQLHGPRMMDTSYMNDGDKASIVEYNKQRAWRRPEYVYDSLPALIQYTRQQEREQKQNAQVPHDSTSAENSMETRRRWIDMIPTDYNAMTNRMYQVQGEEPTYSDMAGYIGLEFPSNSRIYEPMKVESQQIFSEAKKTMKHLNKERKEFFHKLFDQSSNEVNEDAQLNATQLLSQHQYPVETHTVKTDDGYILTLFRILPRHEGSAQAVQKPVVFLMHGLLGSADDWLLLGPGKSLAYMLADNGFEVWLGNARGNKYSRRHVSKHPAQADFWQFSTDEIALHDLPTMIDYALKTSGQNQLQYVGYSQGTTAFFALAASRPEYNKKISKTYALSPMVYMSGARSPMLRMIAPTSSFYQRLHDELGHGEFKPSPEVVTTFGGVCRSEIGCRHVCSNVNFVIAGVNVENMEAERIPVIMSHLPAGGSTRQMKQYGQAVATGDFSRYDYGQRINREVYGSSQPPKYDMTKVETPVTLYYSEDDWMAHPKDVERLAKELPRAETVNVGADFSNMDFLVSKNVSQNVYSRLMDSIKQTENIYVY